MLKNVKVTTFTVIQLLRENQYGGGVKVSLPNIQIKDINFSSLNVVKKNQKQKSVILLIKHSKILSLR